MEKQIYKALNDVAKGIKAIEMTDMKRFKARSIYNIYNRIQPLFAKNGLIIARELVSERESEVTSSNGNKGVHRFQVWKYIFTALDGSTFETTFPSESVDYGDKSASQCDAMGFKQMLIHTFTIPTEDLVDPDNDDQKVMKALPGDYVRITGPDKKRKLKNYSEEELKTILSKFESTIRSGKELDPKAAKDYEAIFKFLNQ